MRELILLTLLRRTGVNPAAVAEARRSHVRRSRRVSGSRRAVVTVGGSYAERGVALGWDVPT